MSPCEVRGAPEQCTSSKEHYPQVVRRHVARGAQPTTRGSVAVCSRSTATHCPRAKCGTA